MKKKKEHSKKFLLIRGSILFLVGVVSLILVIYFNFIKSNSNPFSDSNKMTDSLRFKQEYESLNNLEDTKGKNEYVTVKISDNNPIIYKTSKEIVDILENGTGIVFLGYNKSSWSRSIVEALIDSFNTKELDGIYYLDINDIRNELSLNEDGKIITKKEGTNDYLKMVDILSEYLSPYEGLNDDSIKRIEIPTVIFVRDGKVVDFHVGTVESHTNAKEKLDNNQYNELKEIYQKGIEKILSEEEVVEQCPEGEEC